MKLPFTNARTVSPLLRIAPPFISHFYSMVEKTPRTPAPSPSRVSAAPSRLPWTTTSLSTSTSSKPRLRWLLTRKSLVSSSAVPLVSPSPLPLMSARRYALFDYSFAHFLAHWSLGQARSRQQPLRHRPRRWWSPRERSGPLQVRLCIFIFNSSSNRSRKPVLMLVLSFLLVSSTPSLSTTSSIGSLALPPLPPISPSTTTTSMSSTTLLGPWTDSWSCATSVSLTSVVWSSPTTTASSSASASKSLMASTTFLWEEKMYILIFEAHWIGYDGCFGYWLRRFRRCFLLPHGQRIRLLPSCHS